MKKLYLLLAFVLVFGLLLSACGQAEQPAEEVVEEPAEEVVVEEPAEEVAEEPGDTEGPAPAADGKWCAGTDIVFFLAWYVCLPHLLQIIWVFLPDLFPIDAVPFPIVTL